MNLEEHAKKILDQRIKQFGLTRKNNFSADEAQLILGLSKSSLSRRFILYEKPSSFKHSAIAPLKSQKIMRRRYVNYWDIVAYIAKDAGLNVWSEEKQQPRKRFVEKPLPGATPCPFCASQAITPGKVENGFSLLYCQDCKTSGPMAATLGEALNLWNQRK